MHPIMRLKAAPAVSHPVGERDLDGPLARAIALTRACVVRFPQVRVHHMAARNPRHRDARNAGLIDHRDLLSDGSMPARCSLDPDVAYEVVPRATESLAIQRTGLRRRSATLAGVGEIILLPQQRATRRTFGSKDLAYSPFSRVNMF